MRTSLSPARVPLEGTPLVQAFARERFVEMFLSQNRRAQLGLLLSAVLVAFIWFEATRSVAPLLWIAAVIVVAVLRYAYTETLLMQANEVQRDARIVAVLLVNGVLMAIPLMAFQAYSELERAAISIILLASATASVATTSGFRSVFIAFAAPIILMLALAWASQAWLSRNGAAWGLAALVILYLLFLLSIGRQAGMIFEEVCRYRYGEEQRNHALAKALEDASEANHAKTRFLAAASHDLRQPIHSMNVLVAALGMRELEPRAREIANLLGSVNQILSQQLDALLDISKLDAGVISAEIETHRLDQLVKRHHAATEPVAREREVELLLGPMEPIYVRTDAALLTRAVSNLTDNALKFTQRGGRIRLSVVREQTHALLRIEDNGLGIPLDEQQHVFREFYQVGNVERDRLKGLGLGLSIVRRLCALLEIHVTLESAPGTGTSVTLHVPMTAPATIVPPTELQGNLPPGLSILVVDDELMVRQSMRMLLQEMGCVVHLAEDTAGAARIAASEVIQVVLTDLRLRDHDSGLHVIAAVQATQPAARAVLITGDTAPDRIRDAQAAGIPLLYKPVTMHDLLVVLNAP